MKFTKRLILTLLISFAVLVMADAQSVNNMIGVQGSSFGLWLIGLIILAPFVALVLKLYNDFNAQITKNQLWKNQGMDKHFSEYLNNLDKNQIRQLTTMKNKKKCESCKKADSCIPLKSSILLILLFFTTQALFAQNPNASPPRLSTQPGIIIAIVLTFIPILLGAAYALIKANNAVRFYFNTAKIKAAEEFAERLKNLNDPDVNQRLEKRETALNYHLTNHELSGIELPEDVKGVFQNVRNKQEVHFTALKKKAVNRPALAPDITKLILWYLGCATFWLVLGSGIGEYVGIKFISPDVDHVSWLSFGRLRPVHTNIVFWGWASIGLIGLGYYVVPTVSNTKIYSIKWGWIALGLTNLMVVLGSICLASGINNGGGEFREYIWPVMALFAVALILTLANFLLTVAKRTTKEIYISNWYIVSAIIFTIIVALTAYLPFWQDGVSETIVQGYFMHSGVGMWFTLYTLGLLYYFIPQQINIPIYAYSLGILAFWTQILFYTVIGTHHFVFAPVPWWLQTVAIVGSGGMIIPVVAATINFSMTFKGQWHKVVHSYTLPFFLVAVVYYFIVSMQGTVEAFKFTNLLWHFTDFTVAHAHLGFYGIITFAIWGGVYAIAPRLTGKEPPQHLVGVHFWLAFIGLMFYAIPLSIGATFRGLMWMEGKPFIDSVVMMFDYWLWRAIGGSLMFISHLVFAYNFYKMTTKEAEEIDVKEEAFRILETQLQTQSN